MNDRMDELKAALAEEMRRLSPHAEVARELIVERSRQIEEEGYTPEHDDDHVYGELGDAAAALAAGDHRYWPDGWGKFKPDDCYRRDLVKAGALIIAEIERLNRAAAKEDQHVS